MRNNNFDILRLVAALQVIWIHGIEHLKIERTELINNFSLILGHIPGVPIFFLISGYLISMSYERNSDLKIYAKNRILRIYPALYVNIVIGIIILYIFNQIVFNQDFFIWLFAQMTLIQFYNLEMFRDFGIGVINGSLWTISVELTFYLLLPILFLLYKKSKWLFLLFFILSLLVWFYDLSSSKDFLNKLLHISIVPYLFIFMIGIGFYKFHKRLIVFLENKFIFWLLLYTLFVFISYSLSVEETVIYLLIKWLMFSFMIFSFAFSFKNLSKSLLKGNDYTYGIYIYHMLVVNVFVHKGLIGDTTYLTYIYVLTIVCAALSWHLLEKPILGLKKDSLFSSRKNFSKIN